MLFTPKIFDVPVVSLSICVKNVELVMQIFIFLVWKIWMFVYNIWDLLLFDLDLVIHGIGNISP